MPVGSDLRLRYVAVACALLPLLGVHLAAVLAIDAGHLPACIPYLPDCYSISATGRQAPERWMFRGTMIPAALLAMLLWWRLPYIWRGLRWGSTVRWLGLIAGVSLIAYTLALGVDGESYRVVRRTGVMLWFALTFFNQLLVSVSGLSATNDRWLRGGVVTLLGLGLLSVALAYLLPNWYNTVDNAFEWSFAALLMFNFLRIAKMLS
ncbi:MAG: hypothetical protein DHS20C11_13630 [Lysobacteraceae bacterium]|nr:MAG: hypothetical protein DHS20C11_13630 [Xanthomonadaceae bacterium]